MKNNLLSTKSNDKFCFANQQENHIKSQYLKAVAF